jgi:hypothetical protein
MPCCSGVLRGSASPLVAFDFALLFAGKSSPRAGKPMATSDAIIKVETSSARSGGRRMMNLSQEGKSKNREPNAKSEV